MPQGNQRPIPVDENRMGVFSEFACASAEREHWTGIFSMTRSVRLVRVSDIGTWVSPTDTAAILHTRRVQRNIFSMCSQLVH
jgi:hypothetical protein